MGPTVDRRVRIIPRYNFPRTPCWEILFRSQSVERARRNASHMTNDQPIAMRKEPAAHVDGVIDRAFPADPLADAKAWLAAMEISIRRVRQKAAQPVVVDFPAGARGATRTSRRA